MAARVVGQGGNDMANKGHGPGRGNAGTSTQVAPMAKAKLQIGDVVYHLFSKGQRPDLFQAYLAIRYQVFVVEQGWDSIAHSHEIGATLEDAYDARSLFCVAEIPGAGAVCALRGTKGGSSNDVPHQRLYEAILESKELRTLRDNVATLNSLAVLKHFRGRSVASTAMILLIDALWHEGARIVFGSVEPHSTSARLCARLGFRVVDPPYEYDLPGVDAITVALVIGERRQLLLQCLFGKPERRAGLTRGERVAIDFFSRRERSLMAHEWCKRLVRIRRAQFLR